MSTYIAADNIYWAFSSSAQAVAAFIGFISAGFFFSHDRIDRQLDKDETLVEILTEIKTQHFIKLRFLLWLTGFSIILSLFVVWINGFDTGWFLSVFAILVAFLNCFTVARAVLLVIDMVNPRQVQNTADKLIKESTGEYVGGSETAGISKADFLMKFINLEQLAYNLIDRKNNYDSGGLRSRQYLPFSLIIKELLEAGRINENQFEKLNRVSKMRNLIAHGRLENAGERESKELDELIDFFDHI